MVRQLGGFLTCDVMATVDFIEKDSKRTLSLQS